MKFSSKLATPSNDALSHSQKLLDKIREAILQNDGSISFRDYMEMALYEKGLGYYVAGARKIGDTGDFTTAPEISPLFSQCLASKCLSILSKIKGDILELGAGSGIMAVDIMLELERESSLPEHYYILDLSPELKQRQRQTIEKLAPHLLHHFTWLDTLPESFRGVILGNEVLDAMPIELFTLQGGSIYQHQVIWENEQLLEQLNPAPNQLENAVSTLDIDNQNKPYTSEVNLNLDGWFQALSDCLTQGVIILIDYGYTASEYYHPDRNKGTLICHYQHQVNESPLLYSGLQDITANVDFTAVAESADKAGLQILSYSPQAAFLASNNLEKFFIRTLDAFPEKQYKLAQQVRTLSLPSEMGERFKVITLAKDYLYELGEASSQVDQRYRL
ncbi:MAG TPA: hypothetical protein EYG68_11655 [Leucothrix mucor]|nr:hypothetical protein [Leucothrix mucor]